MKSVFNIKKYNELPLSIQKRIYNYVFKIYKNQYPKGRLRCIEKLYIGLSEEQKRNVNRMMKNNIERVWKFNRVINCGYRTYTSFLGIEVSLDRKINYKKLFDYIDKYLLEKNIEARGNVLSVDFRNIKSLSDNQKIVLENIICTYNEFVEIEICNNDYIIVNNKDNEIRAFHYDNITNSVMVSKEG